MIIEAYPRTTKKIPNGMILSFVRINIRYPATILSSLKLYLEMREAGEIGEEKRGGQKEFKS